MNKKVPVIIGLVTIVILILVYVSGDNIKARYDIDAFALCLRDKETTMYGAAWCPHCQDEKNNFGSAFQYVPYVECPDNPQLCLDKDIKGYPTWILQDGTRLLGEQGLEKLSAATGCPLQPISD